MTKDEDLKRVVKNWANDPWVTHDDITKCGQCWQETILSKVSKEFLESDKEIDKNAIEYITTEAKNRFQETPLYKRVKSMMEQGMALEDIGNELLKEGIEI